jgi:hypothetical protein
MYTVLRTHRQLKHAINKCSNTTAVCLLYRDGIKENGFLYIHICSIKHDKSMFDRHSTSICQTQLLKQTCVFQSLTMSVLSLLNTSLMLWFSTKQAALRTYWFLKKKAIGMSAGNIRLCHHCEVRSPDPRKKGYTTT